MVLNSVSGQGDLGQASQIPRTLRFIPSVWRWHSQSSLLVWGGFFLWRGRGSCDVSAEEAPQRNTNLVRRKQSERDIMHSKSHVQPYPKPVPCSVPQRVPSHHEHQQLQPDQRGAQAGGQPGAAAPQRQQRGRAVHPTLPPVPQDQENV